jgi:hypothetical protein
VQKQLEIAMKTVVMELRDLGFSEKEVKGFQKTLKCPKCGYDFFKSPTSGKWLSHLSHCKGRAKEKA